MRYIFIHFFFQKKNRRERLDPLSACHAKFLKPGSFIETGQPPPPFSYKDLESLTAGLAALEEGLKPAESERKRLRLTAAGA